MPSFQTVRDNLPIHWRRPVQEHRPRSAVHAFICPCAFISRVPARQDCLSGVQPSGLSPLMKNSGIRYTCPSPVPSSAVSPMSLLSVPEVVSPPSREYRFARIRSLQNIPHAVLRTFLKRDMSQYVPMSLVYLLHSDVETVLPMNALPSFPVSPWQQGRHVLISGSSSHSGSSPGNVPSADPFRPLTALCCGDISVLREVLRILPAFSYSSCPRTHAVCLSSVCRVRERRDVRRTPFCPVIRFPISRITQNLPRRSPLPPLSPSRSHSAFR